MNTTYRLHGWCRLLNIGLALFVLSNLAGVISTLVVFVLLIAFLFQQGLRLELAFLVLFTGVLVVIIPLMIFMGIILPLGNAFFSYLRIGPTGLELRVWPGYRLKSAWHQLVRLEQVKILGGHLRLPMLRFREAEIKSWRDYDWWLRLDQGSPHSEFIDRPASFSILDAVFLWSVDKKNLIPVYLFEGWSNGRLRQQLEQRLGQMSLQQVQERTEP